MRLAIISDLHGNLLAFEAALAELTADKPDQIICLGDIVERGPHPRDTLQCLKALNCAVVMGNTDELLLNFNPPPAENLTPFLEHLAWCQAQLSANDFAFMRTFQPTLELDLGQGKTLLAYHGSPRHNRDLIFATTPNHELEPMLMGHIAAVMVGGHSHLPMLRRHYDQLILNPGSIGLAYMPTPDGREINRNRAEYVLLTVERGQVRIEFRQVVYNMNAYIQAVRASGMPQQEWWLEFWQEIS
jgi:putative phosphoesterase